MDLSGTGEPRRIRLTQIDSYDEEELRILIGYGGAARRRPPQGAGDRRLEGA